MMFLNLGSFISLVVLVFLFTVLLRLFRILREYERGVIFTLGRYGGTKGPGLIVVIPFLQQLVRVDTRVVTMDVEPQDVISRDNVSVRVNAVVYFRVVDPAKAIIQVEQYYEATSQLAQTTLRAVLGKHELDEMLTEREKLNTDVQAILDAQTDGWGIKVTNVEIKHIDLNETMIRAMARQAEAERERRAKVIHAEGELQASKALAEAATVLASEPSAMQLRYLDTLTQVAGDKSSTLVFPIPIDLLAGFMRQPETVLRSGAGPESRPHAGLRPDPGDSAARAPDRPE
ncbi:slipin family protein [Castellaniella sp.]|uniref:slipin family protein n=1 Tax=Castellaniella sp. TaxID=1955812 RepID=UPI00355E819B